MAAVTVRCLRLARSPWASGPVRFYRAAPLRRRLGPPPLTDPENQREAAKHFGRLGAASGVAVERLWPSPERLREMEEEEREWCPSLREMEAALERKEREERRLREERWGVGGAPGRGELAP
ncbi:growth arrest and DNA damage-inducible proteins-interacting protein 1 [Meleagris gallopavo]|uniref:growth arrest and DNA damage-inducible proteins-interacting protein 1 n=1 Tax=Meleagris gallopavo TaxID=9103 RepID=UPI000939DB4C|nr:growth arrest and DNA damage-inducible proteins-interacting protein 1 [Meleagris gallopavo]